MMLSKRPQRSPHHISCPVNSELAPCFSSPALLASPPTTPPRTQKHSLSKPMSWLNHTSFSTSNHSVPRAAPRPTRISEPKVGGSLEQFTCQRSGPLGSGATIVRTPQEALFGSSCTFEQSSDKQVLEQDILLQGHAEEEEDRILPSLPHSPPLPPLPDISGAAGESEGGSCLSASPTNIPPSGHDSQIPSLGSPCRSSQPTLQDHPRTPSRSIPVVPIEADLIPPQPPFEVILLSPIPDGPIDPSKLLVTLETCTTTYRTTLRTLVSRPSHLSRYIASLLSPVSETPSVYSNASNTSPAQHTNGFVRDHVASSSCLSQSPNTIHVFLDRPSAPYMHILAYLRTLPNTPERPEMLPRAVQLGSQSPPARLESLLELCDEASYLGLEALRSLCRHEISHADRVSLSTCAGGGGSMLRGHTGSVRSFRPVVEQCQEVRPLEIRAAKCSTGNACTAAKFANRESSSTSSCENKDLFATRERSKERKGLRYEIGSPPPGWI